MSIYFKEWSFIETEEKELCRQLSLEVSEQFYGKTDEVVDELEAISLSPLDVSTYTSRNFVWKDAL